MSSRVLLVAFGCALLLAVIAAADDAAAVSPESAFLGQSLINLPTTESMSKGEVLFRVSHRFYPPVSKGYKYFYGLDGPATIFLSLSYGITDKWSAGLGRTNAGDEVVLSSRLSLCREKDGRLPFSASLEGAAALITEVPDGVDVFDSRNFRGSVQLSVSRIVSDRLSVLLVPSYAYNTDYSRPKDESTFGLGVGGRVVLLENVSLVGEVIPVVSGYSAYQTAWGAGFEIRKGGHIFHVFVNNSMGITPAQYLPGGDLKLSDGDLRVGFNIYRIL